MKKILFFIIFLSLIIWIGILYYVLIKTDLAIAPVNRHSYNLSQGNYTYSPPIALVSYGAGDQVFLSNQLILAQSALNKHINRIYLYGRQDIDEEFYLKNKLILEQSKGAGYWLWKPYFILKTMQQLPDDSIILYADSGVVFSSFDIDNFTDYLKDNDLIMPGNGQAVPLRNHLKKEAQIILQIDKNEQILNSQEIWAYFLVIKNNAETRSFIQEWLTLCEDPNLLTDQPLDPNIQEAVMTSHLHDQSLLSVLAAKYPEKKIILKRYEFRKKLGVDNFHRHPEAKFHSPQFHIAGLHKKIADILYNNFIIVKIREQMKNI
ncbi:MAG: hypothetical protein EKK61_01310 [Rickettsiales bacterium]|nr:MAG: hypothetical protein EKK61_01310 [Rickettsiales bacterium]